MSELRYLWENRLLFMDKTWPNHDHCLLQQKLCLLNLAILQEVEGGVIDGEVEGGIVDGKLVEEDDEELEEDIFYNARDGEEEVQDGDEEVQDGEEEVQDGEEEVQQRKEAIQEEKSTFPLWMTEDMVMDQEHLHNQQFKASLEAEKVLHYLDTLDPVQVCEHFLVVLLEEALEEAKVDTCFPRIPRILDAAYTGELNLLVGQIERKEKEWVAQKKLEALPLDMAQQIAQSSDHTACFSSAPDVQAVRALLQVHGVLVNKTRPLKEEYFVGQLHESAYVSVSRAELRVALKKVKGGYIEV